MHELDSLLWKVKQEADRAQKEALGNPDQAANIYQRYVTAAQKQFMQGKDKAQAVAQDKKVNMAMTKQDSIFPNIHLQGGISSKATEYKNMAMEGQEWRSPIFKLGSASTSSNIPEATKITQKQHNVTGGGVRGPQNIGNSDSMTNQLHDPNAQAAGTANGPVTNDSANFSNQVDNAFRPEGTPATALNGKATNGSTAVTNGHTTLGANNPVVNGRT